MPLTPTQEQEQQFSDDVASAFRHLPRLVTSKLTGRVSSAWRSRGYDGARVKFDEIVRYDLPVIESVNAASAINPDELPGYLFAGLASDGAYGAIRAMSYRFNALTEGDDGDIQMLAQDIAAHLSAEMEHLSVLLADEDAQAAAGAVYAMAAGVAGHFRMEPPEWRRFVARKLTLQNFVIAISQMMGERYWLRNLRHHVRRWRENLHIALGNVRRQSSPYCSDEWAQRWLASRQRGRQIMAETDVVNEETGEVVDLLTLVDRSISDLEKRRAELITRVKGLEQLAQFDGVAQEQNYTGLFFTWTPPGKYHPWLATGHRNRKWNGATPRETQRYFTRTWKQFSAALKRAAVHIFGLRIAQPHHDATPHWHGMLFVREEQAEELIRLFRTYTDREDAGNLNRFRTAGKNTHLDITFIDEKKGSVMAYITRHIGMNIDGCAPGGTDKASGHPYTTLARNASAWASLWGIKQFQFIGSSPVSVWRELRRFRDQKKADDISSVLGDIHRAADNGDWAAYTRLQGGPFTTRKELVVRPWYKPSEQPDECGRRSNILRGVYLPGSDTPPVNTHIRNWTIKKNVKPDALKTNRAPVLTPWTRVNNCIMSKKQPEEKQPDPVLKIPIQLKFDFGETGGARKNGIGDR